MDVPKQPAEAGVALLLAVCVTAVLLTLATGLALVASVERTIADAQQLGLESQYAADAIAEVAVDELASLADWDGVLNGSLTSTAIDGPPAGIRLLADGSPLDLLQVVSQANCSKPTTCSSSEMNAVTGDRPWGVNNPRWQLFAYGNLGDLTGLPSVRSRQYVLALVGDDARENDGDPASDGAAEDNPGCGIVNVIGEAFGPRGTRRSVQVTLARACGSMGSARGTQVLTWRQVP